MGLLANYLPDYLPQDPGQNSAARQGLLQFGAALLGGKGNFGSILGQGINAGAGGYHSALQQLQQQALADAQKKHLDLANQQAQAQLDEPGQIASILGPTGPAAPATAPSTPALLSNEPQASPAPRPLSMLPQMSAAGQPAPPAAKPATQADQSDLFTRYMGMGDKLAQAGRMTAAKPYYELAQKLKPEVQEVKTALDDTGKPVQVITFKDGSQKVSSFGALPDYQVVNNGKTNDLIDKNTGKKGPSYAIGVSPDTEYSRQTQYGVQGMIDRRTEKDSKTQIVQTDDGPVLVDKSAGTGKAITGPNGERLAGVSKPLNDSQSKALLFGTRMQEAHKALGKLATDDKIATSTPGSRLPGIGSVITAFSSEGQQALDQAKRDFINAALRRESGAAIAPSEFDNAEKQYFPQIGDGDKVIAQKARNRELAIRGVLAEVPEKQRASITPPEPVEKPPSQPKPLKDLPKKPPAVPVFDADKEARYQAWKRSQNK